MCVAREINYLLLLTTTAVAFFCLRNMKSLLSGQVQNTFKSMQKLKFLSDLTKASGQGAIRLDIVYGIEYCSNFRNTAFACILF